MTQKSNKFCVYCLATADLSKTHLFSQVIGGKWFDYFCCRRCNSIIGTCIEGEIKKHLFFAQGISETGILPPDQALQHIKITHKDSGERLKPVGGKLMGTAKMRTPTKRVAPPKDMRKLIIKDVRKRFPQWLDRYIREYDSGARSIRVVNEEHTFKEEWNEPLSLDRLG